MTCLAMESTDSMAFYPKTRAGVYDIAKLSRASYNKNIGFCGGQTIFSILLHFWGETN